ncbi:MAG: class I SAM-dependent methyltransferase, partial [Bacteroidota bacterium]
MQTIDPESLQNGQYRSAANLTSRIDLHRSYSRNPYGWFRWVFDQLDLPPSTRLLELACGRGDLWRDNLDRIPPGWDITLTDLSEGMLADAKTWLAGSPHPFRFERADIQDIPFDDGQFDAVIANHMLYYVADKPGAFREVLRVLRPGGYFFTTTVGEGHLRGLA